jgi:heme A synthase
MNDQKPNSLYRLSQITLVTNVLVILWGAYVRATGAGAGCGNHWPLCNGEVIPRSLLEETIIEYTHRITSGIAFILVAILFVLVRRKHAKRHPARTFATFSMVFMIVEALIGAGLVLFDLVAFNTSVTRAVVGAFHLLNTYLLLAMLTMLVESLRDPGIRLFSRRKGWSTTFLYAAMAGMLLVGMSGAITALGDTLFPSESVLAGIAEEFSRDAHFLVRLRIWHPFIAVVASAFVLLGLRLDGVESQEMSGMGTALTLLVLLQLLAGVINVLLLAPIWLQILHLLLADLIWIGLILHLARTGKVQTHSSELFDSKIS